MSALNVSNWASYSAECVIYRRRIKKDTYIPKSLAVRILICILSVMLCRQSCRSFTEFRSNTV